MQKSSGFLCQVVGIGLGLSSMLSIVVLSLVFVVHRESVKLTELEAKIKVQGQTIQSLCKVLDDNFQRITKRIDDLEEKLLKETK